jgi:predicted HicB family RNase H-like nuclease
MMNNLLEYKGYWGSVEFSAPDKVFYGKILGINDLVSFEGNTVSKLEKSFRDMVDDYLFTCQQLGKEPQKAYKGSFNVRISSDLHKKAAIVASRKNLSLNQLVKFALYWVVEHEQEVEEDLNEYANS